MIVHAAKGASEQTLRLVGRINLSGRCIDQLDKEAAGLRERLQVLTLARASLVASRGTMILELYASEKVDRDVAAVKAQPAALSLDRSTSQEMDAERFDGLS